jgi:hypothetical protein
VQARSVERVRDRGRGECDRRRVEGNVNWFWMNVPLEAAFLAVWIGIPMWLVFRHPDRGPDAATAQLSLELQALTIPAADLVAVAAVPGSREALSESLERLALVR